MRDRTPTVHCDAEDGDCGNWDVDYEACCVSAVDDVPISPDQRAPGWKSTDLEDFCPTHAKAATQ